MRDWPPREVHVVEYRLGDEERRFLYRIVRAIEKWAGVDSVESDLAKLSKDSDKLEAETKNLQGEIHKQTGD